MSSPHPLGQPTLAQCSAGQLVTIVAFESRNLPLRRLAEFGLRPGVAVEVRQQHQSNGVVLAYGEERIALTHEAASGIRVRTGAPAL
ncbi:MAG: ferrous iron transport protein A [Rhodospirillaceae bacterium]|nr:ferrous iron transport protein A [Rhodospirillaceae bacterium]